MARGKIEKYGLVPLVMEMHEKGLGYKTISDRIKMKYPHVEDLRDISFMSIKRTIEREKRRSLEKKLKDGDDLTSEFDKEFDKKISELIDDTEYLKVTSIAQLEKAISENAPYRDITRLQRSLRDSLEQLRRGLITLREWKHRDFEKPIEQINLKQEIKIQNFFTELIPVLCNECKRKISTKVDELLRP